MQKTIPLISFLLSLLIVGGCTKKEAHDESSVTWDIDKDGVPKFITCNYIELDKIYRISKFRSAVGHDYSDAFEDCRSMKHYFEPFAGTDWTAVKIFAPITGVVTRAEQEWAGIKIEIESNDYPAFRIVIFHLNLIKPLSVGDKVTAGQQLGTHYSSQTYSDIAVIANDPTHQGRMVSYFETINDQVFSEFQQRGISDREAFIISRAERDAHPLTCLGDSFVSPDSLENWVILP